MQHAASAYAKTAQTTQSPRELEATILMKAATRLQMISDDWDNKRHELDEALTYNRKLWTILVSSVTSEENPLPATIKTNIVNLGMFIFQHTLNLMVEPEPQRIGVLVNINRELAIGLRARPAAEPATT
jgi:flagellar protein FlaF